MDFMRASLIGAATLACLPSCIPLSLPNSKQEPTKAELAKTAPTLPGLTVAEAQNCFPGFAFIASSDEKADLHTGVQKLGESSATVTIVSYATDAVSDVSISIHRPGHATGPLLDRLMTEYLPKLIDVPYDGAAPSSIRSWLTECRLRMSRSGYHNSKTLGSADFSFNVLRNRATLRVSANGRPVARTLAESTPSSSPPETVEVSISRTPRVESPKAVPITPAPAQSTSERYIARPKPLVPSPPREATANEDDREARKKQQALRQRLSEHLATTEPLDTLDAIAAFRGELDAIAAESPDTAAGERANDESRALGLLWVAIRYRNQVELDTKLPAIIEDFPTSRAAREAKTLLAEMADIEEQRD